MILIAPTIFIGLSVRRVAGWGRSGGKHGLIDFAGTGVLAFVYGPLVLFCASSYHCFCWLLWHKLPPRLRRRLFESAADGLAVFI